MVFRKIKIAHRLLILISMLALFSVLVIILFINGSQIMKQYSINNTQDIMLEMQRDKIKVATHCMAYTIAEQIKLSKRMDPRDVIRIAVDKIRFEDDSSGYFFVYENTTNVALPPKKELVGADLGNTADTNGVYFVRELKEQAERGGGFVEYVFHKPGKGTVDKLGYAEMIPGTEIWIGTGVYIDNIDEAKKHIDVTLSGIIRKSILKITFIVIAILLLVVIPFSLLIRRTILLPLNEAMSIANSVSEGELEVHIDTRHNDEVGILAKSLDNMVTNLKKIAGDIVFSSEDLATASQQISSTSDQLSQGASEQAAATEQVSTSIEQMTSNIQQNSENSQMTEKISLS
ncbi:MAG: methyl-accepting chemotaxis protein, partial [Bacteroidales bacterium]|nr:methyl-accepting chemotaxis protein [Bacteroidales bacterium]